MQMKWYTKENGSLCLGTREDQQVAFHSVTNIKLFSKIELPFSPEHAELLGSYPEDWLNDPQIHLKINRVAQQLFSKQQVA